MGKNTKNIQNNQMTFHFFLYFCGRKFIRRMKLKNNHIRCSVLLVLAGFLVHFHGYAQSQTDRLKNQSMDLWSMKDQAQRDKYSRVTVDFDFVFNSRVVCDSSLKSVTGCHIINKTQRMGTVSNAYGDFKITANVNDSITFSALGYEELSIIVTETMYNYGYVVKLKPAIYDLEEVTIRPLIETPMISKWEVYIKPLPNQGGINIPTGMSPVTALYNRFSKEGKQKRYYEKVTKGTADYMLIGEKFNGDLVAQVTGLKDDELIKFMSYCKFSDDFLLNYSPETIKRAIRVKYQEYTE